MHLGYSVIVDPVQSIESDLIRFEQLPYPSKFRPRCVHRSQRDYQKHLDPYWSILRLYMSINLLPSFVYARWVYPYANTNSTAFYFRE